jgi:hypothetical protein
LVAFASGSSDMASRKLGRSFVFEANEASRISSGSYATVFRGRNVDTGEVVAVKVIDLNRFPVGSRERRYLEQEIQIMKAIEHPNVVKLYHSQVRKYSVGRRSLFRFLTRTALPHVLVHLFAGRGSIFVYSHGVFSWWRSSQVLGYKWIHCGARGSKVSVPDGFVVREVPFLQHYP